MVARGQIAAMWSPILFPISFVAECVLFAVAPRFLGRLSLIPCGQFTTIAARSDLDTPSQLVIHGYRDAPPGRGSWPLDLRTSGSLEVERGGTRLLFERDYVLARGANVQLGPRGIFIWSAMRPDGSEMFQPVVRATASRAGGAVTWKMTYHPTIALPILVSAVGIAIETTQTWIAVVGLVVSLVILFAGAASARRLGAAIEAELVARLERRAP